jgi:hypothetical protein
VGNGRRRQLQSTAIPLRKLFAHPERSLVASVRINVTVKRGIASATVLAPPLSARQMPPRSWAEYLFNLIVSIVYKPQFNSIVSRMFEHCPVAIAFERSGRS